MIKLFPCFISFNLQHPDVLATANALVKAIAWFSIHFLKYEFVLDASNFAPSNDEFFLIDVLASASYYVCSIQKRK